MFQTFSNYVSRNVEFSKSFVAFENNGVPKSDPCGTPV